MAESAWATLDGALEEGDGGRVPPMGKKPPRFQRAPGRFEPGMTKYWHSERVTLVRPAGTDADGEWWVVRRPAVAPSGGDPGAPEREQEIGSWTLTDEPDYRLRDLVAQYQLGKRGPKGKA